MSFLKSDVTELVDNLKLSFSKLSVSSDISVKFGNVSYGDDVNTRLTIKSKQFLKSKEDFSKLRKEVLSSLDGLKGMVPKLGAIRYSTSNGCTEIGVTLTINKLEEGQTAEDLFIDYDLLVSRLTDMYPKLDINFKTLTYFNKEVGNFKIVGYNRYSPKFSFTIKTTKGKNFKVPYGFLTASTPSASSITR